MSSEQTPLLAKQIAKGTYVPAGPNDKRSPCPMINSLANHGYLPRNGQNVLAHEMKAAMAEAGISSSLGATFVNTVYNVHQSPTEKANPGFLPRLWLTLRDPWTLMSRFGARRPGQTDSVGRPVLDLDQLALPGAVEHDISLTRRDHAQKEGNCERQEDLVNDLLACSADGKSITREELASVRKQRIEKQREDNPGLTYGPLQHELGCGELALILGVFGDGKSVPYDFVASFLREERLPIKEGWEKRWWWTLGLVEVKLIATKVKNLVGVKI
ncbi:hypothetical protein N0V94_008381 [Neodidymelliopsis sp. IMI 364377]|nr:hypothetical protein N0V94_008381 [Neodidymelliopsis sp. IMI 364377]